MHFLPSNPVQTHRKRPLQRYVSIKEKELNSTFSLIFSPFYMKYHILSYAVKKSQPTLHILFTQLFTTRLHTRLYNLLMPYSSPPQATTAWQHPAYTVTWWSVSTLFPLTVQPPIIFRPNTTQSCFQLGFRFSPRFDKTRKHNSACWMLLNSVYKS